jgi:hypothetical protein
VLIDVVEFALLTVSVPVAVRLGLVLLATVNVVEPPGVVLEVVTVKVADPFALRFRLLGLKLPEAPAGKPETLGVKGPVLPEPLMLKVTVYVTEPPVP